MAQNIDFTNCPRVPGRAYNGANGKKIAVRYADEVWILKFPPNAQNKANDLSYANSCFSEHIGSTIFRLLGIPAQETMLGTHVNGREKIVCACKDFTSPGVRLFDFLSIKNTVLDTGSGGSGTELDDVLETIDQQQYVDPIEVRKRLWQMFIVDAFLGNFDRHNGNWGFLIHEDTGKAELAPVFDCGSCLLPQADERIMQLCLNNQDEMNARIYTFPASMLKQDGHKINYYNFIHSCTDPLFLQELSVLIPKIMALDIENVLHEIPYMTELHRLFLFKYMTERKRMMI